MELRPRTWSTAKSQHPAARGKGHASLKGSKGKCTRAHGKSNNAKGKCEGKKGKAKGKGKPRSKPSDTWSFKDEEWASAVGGMKGLFRDRKSKRDEDVSREDMIPWLAALRHAVTRSGRLRLATAVVVGTRPTPSERRYRLSRRFLCQNGKSLEVRPFEFER
jgi:hypothetical protein